MQIHSVGIDLGKTTFHLVALGAPGKVPIMTLGTYAQAVTSDKREAQDKIAAMILPSREPEVEKLVA